MEDNNINMKENMVANHDVEDDELAYLPITKRPRVTPRSSIATQEPKQTPHANLRALASLIRKPSTPARRRASSAGTTFSASKIPSTTPIAQSRTTPRIRRPLQPLEPSNSNPATPHTIRALRHRRATPGQDRRKSGRTQRETPRDALRNLSKILAATTTQPLRSSPLHALPGPSLVKQEGKDDFEDELSPERPDFTIAIDPDEENDGSFLDRPRLSMPLEEVEETAKSVEVPRRGIMGDEQGRISRGSFGSLRGSGRFSVPENSNLDESHGDMGGDQQWQDVEDDIRRFAGPRDSGGDLQRLIRETSEQDDELSIGHLEPSPPAPGFSPFVLTIPAIERKFPLLHSPADNLSEDDIAQFGTPVPQSNTGASHFLPPVVMQRPSMKPASKSTARGKTRKALKVSRYGISHSSFPVGITKSIATAFARSMGRKKARLNEETMNAILEASDKFFEQLGDDLGVIAGHAGRKTIDESDVITIMQRQRQVSLRATAFSLASRYLPGEILKEMRMPMPRSG